MHVLITAGGIPLPGEQLYQQTLGKPKALVDVNGKPMVQWVLDAVSGSKQVDEIFIVGLSPNIKLASRKILHCIDTRNDALENVIAGVEALVRHDPRTNLFLLVSSDIPALTTEMVDWVISQASLADVDLQYFVIHRRDMEKRFPASRRTYTRFQDAELCAADIFLMKADKVLNPASRWRDLLNARKSPLKQAAIIGFDILFLMLLRCIKLQKAVQIITRRLDLTGRVAFTPYPEMGMDVDKDFQLEVVRKDLKRGLK
ncbi:MAG: NTP transferase domain-containing protein [Anaerolineaceae bacterium]|nr:NTP transferase domain-containing protein [Anaerolineaceae bacterium]MBN2677520.1 NTP transferase domain-containing protein [Anaerolineaceae bacterium]